MKYKHTNLIATDWRRLSEFYKTVFQCTPVPPERDLAGDWLDRITGLEDSHIRGMHLQLPGYGENGPTLEIFQYDEMPGHPSMQPNTPGFAHIAFEVDDVSATAEKAFSLGGTAVGELIVNDIPGVGRLTAQYIADPEGNIIEIQKLEPVD